MVEAVIVTPVILLLVMGMLEFGLLFKDYLTIANATRAGARTASAAGKDHFADYTILKSVIAANAAMGINSINRVTIFRSNSPDGAISANCGDTGSGSTYPAADACNIYNQAALQAVALQAAAGPPYGACPGPGPDCNWAPGDRNDSIAGTGPDYIGVRIWAKHQYVTGIFGQTKELHDTTVMRIEPTQ